MEKMLRALSGIILFSVSLVVQLFWFDNINLFGVKPNIILISVVVISLYNGIYAGTIYSFISGVIMDLIFGSSTGMFTISYTAIGMTLGYMSNKYIRDNYISVILLTSLSVAIFEFIQYVQSMMINAVYIGFLFFVKQLLLSIILNIVLVFLICFVFNKIFEIKGKKSEKIYW